MRVVIAEDSGFFRAALVSALEAHGVEVVAATEEPKQFIQAVMEHRPDAVVVDLCMPPTKTDEGIQLAEHLGKTHPDIGVLILSAHLGVPHVVRILDQRNNGIGCLSKDQLDDSAMLYEALTRVAGGGVFVDPQFVEARMKPDLFKSVLTDRELDMLRAVAEGCNNATIAERCFVSVKTVEGTLTSTFRKLGLDSKDSNVRVKAVVAYLSRPKALLATGRPQEAP